MSEELKHYGIMGMKWGVRRRSVKTAKSSSKPKQRRMSNKELASKVRRMKLEKNYKDLYTDLHPPKQSKIESIVKGVGTVATMTTGALTIYNNLNKLGVIGTKKN